MIVIALQGLSKKLIDVDYRHRCDFNELERMVGDAGRGSHELTGRRRKLALCVI
jgi:hypothetical protein